MGMYGYDSTPLDPQEEERKRVAAVEALASAGTPDPAQLEAAWGHQERSAPPALPERVGLDVGDAGLPGDSGTKVPDYTEPSDDPTAALAATPLQDVADEPKGDSAQDIIHRAASALADFNSAPVADAGSPPVPEATEAAPRPGKGPSDAERSPTAAELPGKDGTPAPPTGQVQTQTPEEAKTATKTDPYDPYAALMQKGEEEKQKALKQLGERPGVSGWALLADVAFNKGRSIPSILQQADMAGRAYDDDKRKMLLSGGHNDPVSQMLQMERIRNTQRGLDQAGDRLTATEKKRLEGADTDQKDREATIASLESLGLDDKIIDPLRKAGSMKAFTQAKNFLFREQGLTEDVQGRVARGKAAETTARVNAESNANAANVEQDAATKSTVAGAVAGKQAEAQAPYLAQKPITPEQQAGIDRKAEEDDRHERERREDIARTEHNRAEDKARQTGLDQTARTDKDAAWLHQFGADTKRQRQEAVPLMQLMDSIEAHGGKDVPGIGIETGDSLLGSKGRMFTRALKGGSPEQQAAQAAHDREAVQNQTRYRVLAESVLRANTGAAANMTEDQRNAITTAQSPTATTEDVVIALGIIRDLLTSDFQTAASGRPELAYDSMKRAGLNPERWGLQAPQVAAQPSAASPSAPANAITPAPGADLTGGPPENNIPQAGSGASGSLGDTGGRRDVPAIPITPPTPDAVGALADAGKPTFKVTVYMPDGSRHDEDAATRDELKMLESIGARIMERK
jgi:Rod binding domain-containing protein